MDQSTTGDERSLLYMGYIYMPTANANVYVMDIIYNRLKEDVLYFRENGRLF